MRTLWNYEQSMKRHKKSTGTQDYYEHGIAWQANKNILCKHRPSRKSRTLAHPKQVLASKHFAFFLFVLKYLANTNKQREGECALPLSLI